MIEQQNISNNINEPVHSIEIGSLMNQQGQQEEQIPLLQREQNANDLNLQKKIKYNKLKTLIEKKKPKYRVLEFEDYDNPLQCAAIIEDKSTNKKLMLKIYNLFNGVNDISKLLKGQVEAEENGVKNLKHTNIVRFQDQFTIRRYYFIVFEYPGTQLKEWTAQATTQLQPIHIIRFSLQLISAIKYANNNNNPFKKLSVYNIYIDEMRQIKICPSGFVNRYSSVFLDSEKVKSDPFFYPPELGAQFTLGDKIEFKEEGDVWQSGIFMYFMSGASQADTVMATNNRLKKLLRFDDSFNQIVSSALQVNQKDRPIASELEITLKNLLQDMWEIPEMENNLLIEAQQCLETDPEKAKSNLIALHEHNPKRIEFSHEIAKIYENEQNFELAEMWYRKCPAIQPNNEVFKEKVQEVTRLKNEKQIESENEIANSHTSEFYIVYKENIFQNLDQQYQPKTNPIILKIVQWIALAYFVIGVVLPIIIGLLSKSLDYPRECLNESIPMSQNPCIFKYSDQLRKSPSSIYNPQTYIEKLCKFEQGRFQADHCCAAKIAFEFSDNIQKKSQKDNQKLIKDIRSCREMNQENYYTYSLLSKAYLNEKLYLESKLTLNQCLKVNEASLDCVSGFAFHYIYTNDFVQADKYLQKCFMLDGQNQICQLYSEILVSRKKNTNLKINMIERIFDRQQDLY